ncbi:MAG TPA: DNA alkylation repair protein [Candidatus Babeliales bacterium]|nr:DNA alkylation repair protein [Candidatus Babeliales bacterium]
MMTLQELKKLLHDAAPQNGYKPIFFKTKPGQYAEHDQFIGVNTPMLKKLTQQAKDLPLSDISTLLQSPINDERQLALLILIKQYQKSENKEEMYQFLLKHLKSVNNWNLVDDVAPAIIGPHLYTHDKSILLQWAQSKDLWERRIAMVATLYFIRQNSFEWTLKIATLLLNDTHDLIHKASGWMLREMGKRDESALRNFLDMHAATMPRTMLRYAIERLPQDVRLHYLKLKK